MKLILFVDYENVQTVDLSGLDPETARVLLFVGKSQTKIPISLVQDTQRFGANLDWVRISGDGKNNLDFHIAFELGKVCGSVSRDSEIVILSKDRGYDSVIEYAKGKYGVQARRINNLSELPALGKAKPLSQYTPEAISNLQKIDLKRLPRTRKSLRKHLESVFMGKIEQSELDLVLEELFDQGKVTETANRLDFFLVPEDRKPAPPKRKRR